MKGAIIVSADSQYDMFMNIHLALSGIASSVLGTPLAGVWQLIPALPFSSQGVWKFYSVVAPPAIIILISGFLIGDYRGLKSYYQKLKYEVNREKNKRDLLNEAGIHETSHEHKIQVELKNTEYKKPHWIKTAVGQIAIGVAVVAVSVAIGLQ